MSIDRMNTLPRFHLPDPNCFIKRTRHDVIRLWVEVHTENDVGVTTQDFDAVTAGGGACVPYAERAVVGGRANVMGIRRPGQIRDAIRVAIETVKEREGGG